MKFRSDFVTNSSSSSFILALHKNAKREDVEMELWKIKASIDSIQKDMDVAPEEMEDTIDDLVNILFFHQGDLELGDWRFKACSFSNEGNIADAVIYEGIRINSDLIKVKMGDY